MGDDAKSPPRPPNTWWTTTMPASTGVVSLGVVISAVGVAVGIEMADPLVSLAITALILRITWQASQSIRSAED